MHLSQGRGQLHVGVPQPLAEVISLGQLCGRVKGRLSHQTQSSLVDVLEGITALMVAGIQRRICESSKTCSLQHRLLLACTGEQSSRGNTLEQEGQEIAASGHVCVLVVLVLVIEILDQQVVNLGRRSDQSFRGCLSVVDLCNIWT